MKYRAFLTPEELAQFDDIVRQQNEHREALRRLRPAYSALVYKGRDRASVRPDRYDPKEGAARWAERFRKAADEMSADPPEGIDPIFWEAQRAAYLSQAEDLEVQAKPEPPHD